MEYDLPREAATEAAMRAAYCCHSFRRVPSCKKNEGVKFTNSVVDIAAVECNYVFFFTDTIANYMQLSFSSYTL
jgi:hypothetical protein